MIYAVIRTTTPFIHYYPDAEGAQFYLRSPHRHLLHIEVKIEQFHDNRDVEYLAGKYWLDYMLEKMLPTLDETTSCEQLAEKILTELLWKYGDNRRYEIQVMEDGENGCLLVE